MRNNALVISLLLLIQFFCVRCHSHDNKPKPKPNSTDFDVLVFTQRWPVSICSQWLKESVNNSCILPIYDGIWTVHGIWPTKAVTKGPWNCNDTWHFNKSSIALIEPDLKQFWINIENNTKLTSLWEHEWVKHGTCAALLPQLNSEFKFFSKGLELIKMYNMKGILSANNIVPNLSSYTIEGIYNSIKKVLNHNPIVQCAVDKNSKQSLLSEVQLCFDKSFNMVDCDIVYGLYEDVVKVGNILTDCSLKKAVLYPSEILPIPTFTVIPDILEPNIKSSFDILLENRNYWITIYKTIKFLNKLIFDFLMKV